MYAISVWEMGAGGCRNYLNSHMQDYLIGLDQDSLYNTEFQSAETVREYQGQHTV